MKRLSIRWKLTLWYGGVLAVVLTLFSGVVYTGESVVGRFPFVV